MGPGRLFKGAPNRRKTRTMDLAKHIHPLSGVADWPLWKRKIRDLLDYHEGTLDVIDRKLKEPLPLEPKEADPKVIEEHRRQAGLYRMANSYAKSEISSAVTDSVYQEIMDQKSAADAWDALKEPYEASSKDQLFKICTEFFASSLLASLFSELNKGLKAKKESPLPELLLVCKSPQILPPGSSSRTSAQVGCFCRRITRKALMS